jgi:phage terminase large subunit GpA-like protein
MGWGEGLESWIIERFSISASLRPEGERFAGLDPSAYIEDWNVLIDQVIKKSYRTSNGFEMLPMVTLCDSGGAEGVTDKAYEFWRLMRAQGLGRKFMLVKGVGNLNAPRVAETWPDGKARKDRTAGRGDVPVWLLNVNSIKDGISGDLAREVPGPAYVHIPECIDEGYFSEITAETRTTKGWVKQGNRANEAFDLHTYNRAACILLRAEAINWQRPPKWAKEPPTDPDDIEPDPPTTKKRRRPPGRNWISDW